MEQGLPSEGLMASCKLQEQILIQLFPSGPLSGGQEDVTPDVLVHDAAASRHTAEGHIDVFIELNGHLPYVPVDVPLPHVAEAPGLDHVTHGQINPDESVVGNA